MPSDDNVSLRYGIMLCIICLYFYILLYVVYRVVLSGWLSFHLPEKPRMELFRRSVG